MSESGRELSTKVEQDWGSAGEGTGAKAVQGEDGRVQEGVLDKPKVPEEDESCRRHAGDPI